MSTEPAPQPWFEGIRRVAMTAVPVAAAWSVFAGPPLFGVWVMFGAAVAVASGLSAVKVVFTYDARRSAVELCWATVTLVFTPVLLAGVHDRLYWLWPAGVAVPSLVLGAVLTVMVGRRNEADEQLLKLFVKPRDPRGEQGDEDR